MVTFTHVQTLTHMHNQIVNAIKAFWKGLNKNGEDSAYSYAAGEGRREGKEILSVQVDRFESQ